MLTMRQIYRVAPCQRVGDQHWDLFCSLCRENGITYDQLRRYFKSGSFPGPSIIDVVPPIPSSMPVLSPLVASEAPSVMIRESPGIYEMRSVIKIPLSSVRPLVSVVIPTYKRRDLVVNAVGSVLAQTYRPLEVVVVEDGSQVGTEETLRGRFEAEMKLGAVRYFWKPNGGIGSTLNWGIQRARGELVAWLSDDDWYDCEENTLLEHSVSEHVKDPTLGMTYASYSVQWEGRNQVTVYEAAEFPTRKAAFEHLLKECFINGSSSVYKKKVFDHIGHFNEWLKYGQDLDFYYRLLMYFGIKKVPYVRRPLLNYRMNAAVQRPTAAEGCRIETAIVKERARFMAEKGRQTVTAMVCMKDEKALIDQCLNDLSMYVDQIVLFDDGSTDGSEELVKKWSKISMLHRQAPKGNVRTEGVDRQKLLEMMQAVTPEGHWGLFIDCDEVFEDRYKTDIWKEIKNPEANLWYYREMNFWRSTDRYRVDELWNKGWFGRLFRNMPGLTIRSKVNEHCGGVPCNIPGAGPHWAETSICPSGRRSSVRCKHWGYADRARAEARYRALMERDTDVDLQTRHLRYDRMLDENGIRFEDYQGDWYWTEPKPEETGVAATETSGLSGGTDRLRVLMVNLVYDPAGVNWYLHDALNAHTTCRSSYVTDHIHVKLPSATIKQWTTSELNAVIDEADIIHFNQYHPWHPHALPSNIGKLVDWKQVAIKKPWVLHLHGGNILYDPSRYLRGVIGSPKIIVCSPLYVQSVPHSVWLPNVLLLDHPLYQPEVRDWGDRIMVAQKMHSRNVDYIKGTKALAEVINTELRDNSGFPIQMDTFTDMGLDECLTRSGKHHICIDNITQGFVGMSAWEGLAKNQLVIARLDPIVEEAYRAFGDGDAPPIVNVRWLVDLAAELRRFCEHRSELRDQSLKGRPWMTRHYTPKRIAGLYTAFYEKAIEDWGKKSTK